MSWWSAGKVHCPANAVLTVSLCSLPPLSPERANLPRNMIENSMFQEEPDVVDLAKDSAAFPVNQALPGL